ncbi:MAG: helix-turn-helix domain-containing protein [Candidatus Micrarchaeaceae archaeon]
MTSFRSYEQTQVPGGWAMVPKAILTDPALTPPERLVWIGLACFRFHGNAMVWPSVAQIAQFTGFSERHVYRCLKSLEAKGYIVVDRNPGQRSRYELRFRCEEWEVVEEGSPQVPPTNGHPCQDVTPDNLSPLPLTSCHPTPDNLSPLDVGQTQSPSSSASAPKEDIKKKKEKRKDLSSLRFASKGREPEEALFQEVLPTNGKARKTYKDKELERWNTVDFVDYLVDCAKDKGRVLVTPKAAMMAHMRRLLDTAVARWGPAGGRQALRELINATVIERGFSGTGWLLHKAEEYWTAWYTGRYQPSMEGGEDVL